MLICAAKLSFKKHEETAAVNKMASRENTQDVIRTFYCLPKDGDHPQYRKSCSSGMNVQRVIVHSDWSVFKSVQWGPKSLLGLPTRPVSNNRGIKGPCSGKKKKGPMT